MWPPIRSCNTPSHPIISIMSYHIPSQSIMLWPFPSRHVTSHHVTSCRIMLQHDLNWRQAFALSYSGRPFPEDQTPTSQLHPLLIYGTRYLPLQFAGALQSKHIYCNVTLVEKEAQSMSIDREQSEPCPQVLLSRSPRAVPGNPSLRGRQIFPAEWGRRGCGVKRYKVNQHLSVYPVFSHTLTAGIMMLLGGASLRHKKQSNDGV